MKRMIGLLLALLLLSASSALAGEYSPGCLHEPPVEVLEHIASRWSGHELEDYCRVEDGSWGAFGFALLRSGKDRLLVGYRQEKGGRMVYWLKNAGAVPQGDEEAWFELYTDRDGFPGFCVIRLDDAGESYEQRVCYSLQPEGFRLTQYAANTVDGVVIHDGFLEFWDTSYPRITGLVTGEVQTDLAYVSYGSLPKTIAEGRGQVTVPPRLAQSVLQPKTVKFEGGKKYDVYTGPGKEYARSGGGKGSVSTNDWIQVFGEYNGFIMIQYDISAEQYRIGWIDASAMPKGERAQPLALEAMDQTFCQDVIKACALTDDPFNSRKAMVQLEVGHELIELIHDYDGWSYVKVEVGGKTYCGFVPTGCISHG
ncbi:MAG: hypothetical protein J6K32_00880 [Clostridia bacterium]|nr:hypothetical protein [Clostridia bacterium]